MAVKQKSPSPEQQATLQRLAQEYVEKREKEGVGIDYRRLPIDVLLALEAVDDWSNGRLVEGDDIRLTFCCTDPCAATWEALRDLVLLLHKGRSVLYPVSGFNLGPEDSLTFSYVDSSYRLTPHVSGSRFDAVGIARGQGVDDAQAAKKLWLVSAVEDCIAYLDIRLQDHGLILGADEYDTMRRILSSALQRFSIGQAWNVIWRAVKHCAALSTQRYFNLDRASRQVPKKVDLFFDEARQGKLTLISYDRVADNPMGAILTLMAGKFGITDETPGATVQRIFEDLAANTPPRMLVEDSEDEGQYLASCTGKFYLSAPQLTDMEAHFLSYFQTLKLKPTTHLDEAGNLYVLPFTIEEAYGFDGFSLVRDTVEAITGQAIPEEATQAKMEELRAADRPATEWSACREVLKAMLTTMDLSPTVRGVLIEILSAIPADIVDVFRFLQRAEVAPALQGLEVAYADIYPGGHAQSFSIVAGKVHTSLPLPQGANQGAGASDLVAAASGGNVEAAGTVMANIIRLAIYGDHNQATLLRAIAKRLNDLADQEASEADASQAAPQKHLH